MTWNVTARSTPVATSHGTLAVVVDGSESSLLRAGWDAPPRTFVKEARS
jgi:hypothetical protein